MNNPGLGIAFSPDGNLLAIANDPFGNATLWNRHGTLIRQLEPARWVWNEQFWFGPSELWTPSWSADSTLLFTGTVDGHVIAWEVESGEPRWITRQHTSLITDFAFNAQHHILASRTRDGQIILWSVTDGQPLDTLEMKAGSGGGLQWSADGETLIGAWGDGFITSWHIFTDQDKHTFAPLTIHGETFYNYELQRRVFRQEHIGRMRGLGLTTNAAIAIVGSDVEVFARHLDSGEIVALLPGTGRVSSVAFDPQGELLAAGSEYGLITLWDMAEATMLKRLAEHTDDIADIAFSPNGELLATASGDLIIIWDTEIWQPQLTLHEDVFVMKTLAFSPDSQHLAAASYDYTRQTYQAAVWDMNTGHQQWRVTDTVGGTALSWSPNGQTLVVGGTETITFYVAKTGERVHTLASPGWNISWAPGGVALASADLHQETITIWNTENMQQVIQPVHEMTYHGSWVTWSADWAYFASGEENGLVQLYDMTTGKPLYTLSGHQDSICSLVFSMDNTMLATGSGDGSIIVWDIP